MGREKVLVPCEVSWRGRGKVLVPVRSVGEGERRC